MPRDVNGNMTLVAGNPVVSGTAISSTVHNDTIADLAAEIEDSLSRSGKGGMLVPMQFFDGTAAAPGAAFANETGTGWWRKAAGQLAMSILGVQRALLSATGLDITGNLNVSGSLTYTQSSDVSISVGGTFADSTDNWVTVTQVGTGLSLDVTVTTTGRPIFVGLINGSSGQSGFIGGVNDAPAAVVRADFRFSRTGTSSAYVGWQLVYWNSPGVAALNEIDLPASSMHHIDILPAGTYTYNLQMKSSSGTNAHCGDFIIVAYEL